MKIIIAPDSFKGSLNAFNVAEAIETGIKRVSIDVDIKKVPMADGGEGTVDSLVAATDGEIRILKVTGPLGDIVEASYGILGDGKTAVIETASASGLPLIPDDKKNPMLTTTYGTGELIKAALDEGCRNFIIGLGGSATNDGGVGMAQALGISIRDKDGQEIGYGGGELCKIARIDISGLDSRIEDSRINIACDVDNPLCGPTGASAVYGPQKGATPEMANKLDQGLANLAKVIKRDIGEDVKNIPGSGAAGGLGAALIAFLRGEMRTGVDIVIEVLKLEKIIKGSDLVITGEGQIDEQTVFGKTPVGVAKIAKKYAIPVVAIAGSVGTNSGVVHQHGIDAVFSIVNRPMSLGEAMADVQDLLSKTSEEVIRLFALKFT